MATSRTAKGARWGAAAITGLVVAAGVGGGVEVVVVVAGGGAVVGHGEGIWSWGLVLFWGLRGERFAFAFACLLVVGFGCWMLDVG